MLLLRLFLQNKIIIPKFQYYCVISWSNRSINIFYKEEDRWIQHKGHLKLQRGLRLKIWNNRIALARA